MKNFLIALALMTGLQVANSYALAEQSLDVDSTFNSNELEVSKLAASTPKEKVLKKSLLKKIRMAREGFREWKKDHANHKEIKAEFESVQTKLTTKGTPEHTALSKVLKDCKTNTKSCLVNLSSTLESIYTKSELPVLATNKSFSIINSSYASSVNVNSCENGFEEGQYFLGLFGTDKECGVSYVGAGLGYAAVAHAQLCLGNGKGVNVGPYAGAALLFGAGVSLTFGQGGICQIISVQLGLNGFSGFLITDNFGQRPSLYW